MKKLVLDTNVVVSALLWDGAPRRLLEVARSRKVLLFTSVPLISELTKTLSRAKFQRKIEATHLSLVEITSFYADLAIMAVPLPTPRLAPDPDDDVVIGTATGARADLLVTGDHALLTVSTFAGGRIVSVQDALQIATSI